MDKFEVTMVEAFWCRGPVGVWSYGGLRDFSVEI